MDVGQTWTRSEVLPKRWGNICSAGHSSYSSRPSIRALPRRYASRSWSDRLGFAGGTDFHVGYSPERINPGDRKHTLDKVIKVVSAQDAASLNRVASVYEQIVAVGVHRAPSIRVAEAAKVIENTQRDLNIALVNELALIFDRMGLSTTDVLKAAGTKWNFLPFTPGLVGGHCIGVDPYYLTARAEALGYHPDVILAGRRVNDGMGAFVASKLIKLMASKGKAIQGARVGVLGLTFKENVPDIRNSRVPDIVRELSDFGLRVLSHDPLADPEEVREELGVHMTPLEELVDLDAAILTVPHRAYLQEGTASLLARLKPDASFVDVKSAVARASVPDGITYWSL